METWGDDQLTSSSALPASDHLRDDGVGFGEAAFGQEEVVDPHCRRQQDEHLQSHRELLVEDEYLGGVHGSFGEVMDGGGQERNRLLRTEFNPRW